MLCDADSTIYLLGDNSSCGSCISAHLVIRSYGRFVCSYLFEDIYIAIIRNQDGISMQSKE